MQRFMSRGFAVAAFCAASIGAAEYRFEMWGTGSNLSNWAYFAFDSTNMVEAEPSAPPGIEVSYPSPPGSDSLTWRSRRSGLMGRTCLSCPSSGYLPWLSRALAAAPLIPEGAQVLDTQQVTVDGESRAYITASKTAIQFGFGFQSAFLEGVGTIYYQEESNPLSQSHWIASVRLLEYNGIDIDSLWGEELPHPVAIAVPSRETAPHVGARRFDMREMGIFLGRKSALKAPLPPAR